MKSLCRATQSLYGRDVRARIIERMDVVSIALALVVFALLLAAVAGIDHI